MSVCLLQVLREVGAELKNAAMDPALADPMASRSSSVEHIDALCARAKDSLERGNKYEEWQGLFGITEPATYPEIEETAAELQCLQRLWHAIHDLEELGEQWRTTVYLEADVTEYETTVARFSKVAAQSAKALPRNMAVPVLQQQAAMWSDVMPVLIDLRRVALCCASQYAGALSCY